MIVSCFPWEIAPEGSVPRFPRGSSWWCTAMWILDLKTAVIRNNYSGASQAVWWLLSYALLWCSEKYYCLSQQFGLHGQLTKFKRSQPFRVKCPQLNNCRLWTVDWHGLNLPVWMYTFNWSYIDTPFLEKFSHPSDKYCGCVEMQVGLEALHPQPSCKQGSLVDNSAEPMVRCYRGSGE